MTALHVCDRCGASQLKGERPWLWLRVHPSGVPKRRGWLAAWFGVHTHRREFTAALPHRTDLCPSCEAVFFGNFMGGGEKEP